MKTVNFDVNQDHGDILEPSPGFNSFPGFPYIHVDFFLQEDRGQVVMTASACHRRSSKLNVYS